ncbi:MAG TPA: glycosyltransferase [Candidatus Baltobacteraceae bacterium]|nr:glycosyltransferase [Candidatus Baltobacteraceae bacterium]
MHTLLSFSHLRWNFVYQRPQHVLSRIAAHGPVLFLEEPVFVSHNTVELQAEHGAPNVTVLRPVLPERTSDPNAAVRGLLDEYLVRTQTNPDTLWYYTPMALDFTRDLTGLRVYDCMDELSAFANAPAKLRELESELFSVADVVFTGGRSLYYSKRKQHGNVHCFPSAVEASHFAPAGRGEPAELRSLRRPRIGFYGVLDERLDIAFVSELAQHLHDWEIVMVGPVVKIERERLPIRNNIHYVGMKAYEDLPALLEHWDIAFLPFARNDATRFISPTKTLEYLAANKPVISTPIADVVDPYGKQGLVHIASSGRDAADAARMLYGRGRDVAWQRMAQACVAQSSWDNVVRGMMTEMKRAGEARLETAV